MSLGNYRILFIVFLVITVILGIVLIAMYFSFDIWRIIQIKTGWAVKQSIKELNEMNQQDDVKKRKRYKGRSVSFSGPTGDVEETQDMTHTLKLNKESNEMDEINETVFLDLSDQKTDSIVENCEVDALQEHKPKYTEQGQFKIINTKVIIFSEGIKEVLTD